MRIFFVISFTVTMTKQNDLKKKRNNYKNMHLFDMFRHLTVRWNAHLIEKKIISTSVNNLWCRRIRNQKKKMLILTIYSTSNCLQCTFSYDGWCCTTLYVPFFPQSLSIFKIRMLIQQFFNSWSSKRFYSWQLQCT